jgi:hypothetical protein
MAQRPSRPTVPFKLVYLAPNMKHTVHALLNFWNPVRFRINQIMAGDYLKYFNFIFRYLQIIPGNTGEYDILYSLPKVGT